MPNKKRGRQLGIQLRVKLQLAFQDRRISMRLSGMKLPMFLTPLEFPPQPIEESVPSDDDPEVLANVLKRMKTSKVERTCTNQPPPVYSEEKRQGDQTTSGVHSTKVGTPPHADSERTSPADRTLLVVNEPVVPPSEEAEGQKEEGQIIVAGPSEEVINQNSECPNQHNPSKDIMDSNPSESFL
ncbi:hypothetical protein LguiA_036087 [Lonicera macranthoides]